MRRIKRVILSETMPRVMLSIGLLQVLAIILGLLRAKGLSWALGPAAFGVVSTIDQAILAIMQLGAFGIPFTALKYIARSHSESPESFRRVSGQFVRLLGVLSLASTAVAAAALFWRPALLGADLAPYSDFLLLALLGIPGMMLNILFVNTLAASGRGGAAAGLHLLVAALLATASVAGVILGGIGGLYIASGVTGLTALAGSVFYMQRALGLRLLERGHPAATGQSTTGREVIGASASIYVAMVTYTLCLYGVRYVVLADMGEVAAGLMQASLSIALTVGAVLNPLSNLYLVPLVNRRARVEEKVHAANEFAQRMLVLLLLGALPAVLFPRLLLTTLYTSEFAPVAATMFLFVLWQCVFQIANIYQQLLIGLDDLAYMAITATVGYASAALLAKALVPVLGLAGAALALILGMTGYGISAAGALRIRHRVGVPHRIAVRAVYVGIVVVSAGMLFTGENEGTLQGMLSRLGFASVALVGMWALLTPDERSLARRGPALLTAFIAARRVASVR